MGRILRDQSRIHKVPSGSRRVDRGGGWHTAAGDCRVSYRGNDKPDSRYDNLGFRLLRTAP